MGSDMKKKKKIKEEKMQPSSSRRETSPDKWRPPKEAAVGCMSGILQLLSRRNSRRRILSGRKDTTANPPEPSPGNAEVKVLIEQNKDGMLSRRSPTLPSEIRLSGGFQQEDSPRRPPSVVARLMGLEESSSPEASAAWFSPESAEEKRRMLLCALERCDEDLRALKGIIEAVRKAEILGRKAAGGSPVAEMKCVDAGGEQPSPVSVLDALASPKFHLSENGKKKNSRASMDASCLPGRRITTEGIPRRPAERNTAETLGNFSSPEGSCGSWRWRLRRSEALVESVGEVWQEAAVAERRELERVGEGLEYSMVGDLVVELVMEMLDGCSNLSLHRSGGCKRNLCF
ncbi:hypothetical protein AXF42_Ash021082 [Apostasia shenzhenica]|uniref:DUF3741 domain-containing protein n=1 Tax=Apostasia shenzhenica TaxID=1088818 RepID=A0A2H9ZXW3_9ASPA|nr:hypothetical protein AXF42_Ash021082 [Apostasia shenzhenica]